MTAIVERAKQSNTRIFIDAEQQSFQPTINAWTLELMREHNVPANVTENGPLIYTTMQAYLKSTRSSIIDHLRLSHEEGWTLGIKLVRGAYISTETRSLIHDTKADTDAAYDEIVKSLLEKTMPIPGVPQCEFPYVGLLIAGHNSNSVQQALAIENSIVASGGNSANCEYGQILGMADEISCQLVQMGQKEAANLLPSATEKNFRSRVLKASVWGSTQECMQFLLRRAIENQAAVTRTREWKTGLKTELWRRLTITFRSA